jgi:hypothetical protein
MSVKNCQNVTIYRGFFFARGVNYGQTGFTENRRIFENLPESGGSS